MAKFDIFVGRHQELALIEKWSKQWNTTHWILIGGEGGIGKTFLLNKVLNHYADKDNYTVVHYDLSEQPPGTLREALHIVESIGWQHFPHFEKEINHLNSGAVDIADVRLSQLEQQALMTLMDELRDYLHDKRLIRLTDTLDIAANTPSPRPPFYTYGQHIPNLLGITAGRKAKEHLPKMQHALGKDNVTYIELNSFTPDESRAFFAEIDADDFIPHPLRTKLHFLTDGRPILLSLAAEWLAHDVALPEIVEQPLSTLQDLPAADRAALRERFQFELVNRVRQLSTPLDRAILYIAHVDRRSDEDILAVLLAISEDAAEDVIEALATLSFVKYNHRTDSCMLHDEMKVLVNRYAWPYVDPTGDIRHELTRTIIDHYYKPRIAKLAQSAYASEPTRGQPVRRTEISPAEWEMWRLEAECLHYHLALSQEQGFAYFEEHFAAAHRNNHLIRMQFLIGEMEAVDPHIRNRMYDRIELRRAESLRLSGQLDAARNIGERTLSDAHTSPENHLSAHITLGWIAAKTDPTQAIAHFSEALQHAQEQDNARLEGVLYNNLGQIHQATGKFDAAIAHYQNAVRVSQQVGNPILVASAKNNMAYVYRLQGNLTTADAICRVALVQRRKLHLERDLAFSYLTKAAIDRDKGDLESAERYIKLALRIFDKVDEKRGQAMAYNSLANIHRHLNQYRRATSYLERAEALALQLQDEPLLATVYDIYGREQRDHAAYLQEFNGDNKEQITHLFANATRYLAKNRELCAKYDNPWLLIRAEYELALTHFLNHTRTHAQILAQIADVQQKAAQIGYSLIQGYIEELRGEIAFRENDHTVAARHFGLAAPFIGQFSGREAARFFDRIADYLLDINLTPEQTQLLACGILNVIGVSATADELGHLQTLCPAQNNTPGLQTTYPGSEALETLKTLCQQLLL